MKEKHNNGCNSLITTFANLESYVYSKKCLKQRRQPPQPPPPPPTALSSKVEGIFRPKKSPGYGCYLQLNMSIQQIE